MKISKEIGERLLKWEKEGIMHGTLDKNRYILNFYKEQIEKKEKKKEYQRIHYQKIKKELKIGRIKILDVKKKIDWLRRKTWAANYQDCSKINEWFDGCEGHHISKNKILHIPKWLHRSVSHNLKTGRGMKLINNLAMEWFEIQHLK